MSFKSLILEVTEDLSSLEVATLTTRTGPLDLSVEISPDEEKKIEDAEERVKNARMELLEVLDTDELVSVTDTEDALDTGEEEPLTKKQRKKKIRNRKRSLREAQKQLDETKKAIGIYSPKDLFSKIRSKLPSANLVAYSRFELEGDSTNFINSDPDVLGLVARHDYMVAASHEARKSLFTTVLRLDKEDKL